MKKLSIIGRGTAGAIAITHFLRYTDWEIDWHFDDNIKPQSVGEGSNTALPTLLFGNINFEHHHLEKIDGSFKYGIYKEGWGNGKGYFHTFRPPFISYHFNANKLQNYIYSLFKDNPRITIKNQNITNDQIDSDFIFDCSGKPDNYDDYYQSKYIPVNSVHVTQCYWDNIKFQHSLTIARPYGWIFGIPLGNRCSIGYLYNNNINTIEEIEEDVKEIFKQFDLTPSESTNSFSFNNYYRKENFSSRIAYSGNSSFFLEPLEATSIGFMDTIQRFAYDIWVENHSVEDVNMNYIKEIKDIEAMIMLHYFAGSSYKTPFWDMAVSKAENCFKDNLPTNDILSFMVDEKNRYLEDKVNQGVCGSWPLLSWNVNMENLDVYPKMQQILKEVRGE